MLIRTHIDASRAFNRLDRLKKDLKTPPWLQAGEIGRRSVHQNFDTGGRYSPAGGAIGGSMKWSPRKTDRPWPILRKTDTLRNSHYVEKIHNGVAIGNRIVYAAAHNFGYPPRNLDARPFLNVAPADVEEMRNLFRKHMGF